MIEQLVTWATSSLLGIGVSTTAIVLVLGALQARRGLKYGGMVARWYRYAIVTVVAIGLLIAGGVFTGVNVARIGELVDWLIEWGAGVVA